ncbi:MAG: FKBP-type peptidyl-prolyl cis-trans isomerase [Candidatus Synoicihabitans palmerolidicus]|nr:FKBP-type peptidyl-prolyl cis-trans isomerase [Candidatus Synoicihabitans palmerolidicus]
MKSIFAVIFVIGLLGSGLWWFAGKRHEEIAAQRVAAEQAAMEADRAAKLELYGEAALAKEIVWSSSGLGMLTLEDGTGSRPYPGAYVKFKYAVKLKDGTSVDHTGKPTEARIGQMIPGVSSGLQQMNAGAGGRFSSFRQNWAMEVRLTVAFRPMQD